VVEDEVEKAVVLDHRDGKGDQPTPCKRCRD
jgi:hypothetical protein